MTQHKQVSDETAYIIDQEVRKIIDENYRCAEQILNDKRETLEMMADALMKYETLDESQLKEIMQGKKPSPPADWDRQDPPVRPADDLDSKKKDGSSVGDRPAEQH